MLLILQNASVSLLTRLSRTPSTDSSSAILYSPSSAVFLAEIMKFTISLLMISLEKAQKLIKKERKGHNELRMAKLALEELLQQREEVIKLAVPAALYAMQNTLLVSSTSNPGGSDSSDRN